MVFYDKKQNLEEIVDEIKALVGKHITVVVAGTNGKIAGKFCTYTDVYQGKLKKVEEKDNLYNSRLQVEIEGMGANDFPILTTGNDPVYQCGVALLLDDKGKIVLKNLEIIKLEDCYKKTIENNFEVGKTDNAGI